MNVRSGPVAIYDSGLGGLSVLREMRRLLPAEPLLYVADSRYCPYGDRSPEEIRSRAFAIGDAVVALGARLLIVACNTACSVALEDLRARLPMPIVGLEPAIKPAALRTRTGEIAVLVTPRTAAGARLKRLIDRYAADLTVHVLAGRGLVELVEAGELAGPRVDSVLGSIFGSIAGRPVDMLVLGCTHYPFLRRSIADVLGTDVHLIESGEAVARRARQLLGESEPGGEGARVDLRLLTTGNPLDVARVAGRLLGQPVVTDRLAC